MFTKDDLIQVQEEAKRQQAVAIERLERATAANTDAADALVDITNQRSLAEDSVDLVTPLLEDWGRTAEGKLDPKRPVLKGDIEAKVAAAKAEAEDLERAEVAATTRSESAQAELTDAKKQLDAVNRALQRVDAAIRSAP